jgi:predicted translin family RNA/ssDNA-binding protein
VRRCHGTLPWDVAAIVRVCTQLRVDEARGKFEAERQRAARAEHFAVSLKRLLDESPWLQFTSECQLC